LGYAGSLVQGKKLQTKLFIGTLVITGYVITGNTLIVTRNIGLMISSTSVLDEGN